MVNDENLKALREAWLDMPFDGVVPHGVGQWLQPLINAVSEIVDPDRTLRLTDEALKRGRLADLRSRHTHAAEQVRLAGLHSMADDVAKWTDIRDENASLARAEFGVEL